MRNNAANPDSPKVYFYLGKIAIGNALLLTLILALALVISVIVSPSVYMDWVAFSTDKKIAQSWWRVFTYLFYVEPHVWGIVHVIFLGYFGKQVEESMERRDFLCLLLGLWLLPPLLAYAAIPIGHSMWAGTQLLSFGIFLTVVCMQPNRPFFFGVRLKWFGVVYLLGYLVMFIAHRAWPMLAVNVITWFCVWWWVKRQGYARVWGVLADMGVEFVRKSNNRSRQKVTSGTPKLRPRTHVDTKASSAVDRILDKVSKDGIHSLTEKERRILMDASDEMK